MLYLFLYVRELVLENLSESGNPDLKILLLLLLIHLFVYPSLCHLPRC